MSTAGGDVTTKTKSKGKGDKKGSKKGRRKSKSVPVPIWIRFLRAISCTVKRRTPDTVPQNTKETKPPPETMEEESKVADEVPIEPPPRRPSGDERSVGSKHSHKSTGTNKTNTSARAGLPPPIPTNGSTVPRVNSGHSDETKSQQSSNSSFFRPGYPPSQSAMNISSNRSQYSMSDAMNRSPYPPPPPNHPDFHRSFSSMHSPPNNGSFGPNGQSMYFPPPPPMPSPPMLPPQPMMPMAPPPYPVDPYYGGYPPPVPPPGVGYPAAPPGYYPGMPPWPSPPPQPPNGYFPNQYQNQAMAMSVIEEERSRFGRSIVRNNSFSAYQPRSFRGEDALELAIRLSLEEANQRGEGSQSHQSVSQQPHQVSAIDQQRAVEQRFLQHRRASVSFADPPQSTDTSTVSSP